MKRKAKRRVQGLYRKLRDYLTDGLFGRSPTGRFKVLEVDIEKIDPNPYQTRQEFGEEGLEELASSIRAHGFYGHLMARRKGRRYQLAYGERRLRAAKRAGLKRVPLAVRKLSDGQMLELSITENIQRQDLKPMEEAAAYALLRDELGYSIREIASRVGRSKSHIADLLKIYDTPDVAEAVRRSEIPDLVQAREIARVKDAEARRELIEKAAKGLGREEIKREVKKAKRVRLSDTSILLKSITRSINLLEKAINIAGSSQIEMDSVLDEKLGELEGKLMQLREALRSDRG
jgi:ParB family chromosome partitioning protein